MPSYILKEGDVPFFNAIRKKMLRARTMENIKKMENLKFSTEFINYWNQVINHLIRQITRTACLIVENRKGKLIIEKDMIASLYCYISDDKKNTSSPWIEDVTEYFPILKSEKPYSDHFKLCKLKEAMNKVIQNREIKISRDALLYMDLIIRLFSYNYYVKMNEGFIKCKKEAKTNKECADFIKHPLLKVSSIINWLCINKKSRKEYEYISCKFMKDR